MTPGHPPLPPDDDACEAAAASWLAQREEGFTPEQEAEFLRWRLADPRHGAAVARLEETGELLGQLPLLRGHPRLEGGLAAPSVVPAAPRSVAVGRPGTPEISPARRSRRLVFGLAALAASLALVALHWALPRPGARAYATTVEGYQRVLLPDHSVAQLNGGTRLKVDYSDRERRIALSGGEAHFHVAKDPARPFVVTARGVSVRAVGTAFNVRVVQGGVDVLVTEGVVHVERVGRGGGDLLTLAAGERALVPPAAAASAVAVEQVDPGQVRAALAWQEPRLVFVEAPLADVVARFNERNRLQLELADPDLAARVVGGTFRPDDVETFVRLLEGGGEIAVERRGDRVVLRRR